MYSKDIFLERAQQALLDGGIVFSTFLAAAILRHSGAILDPLPGHHFEIGPYLFPATLLAVMFILLFRYERLYSGRFGRFAEAFRIARGAAGGTGRVACSSVVGWRIGARNHRTLALFPAAHLVRLLDRVPASAR